MKVLPKCDFWGNKTAIGVQVLRGCYNILVAKCEICTPLAVCRLAGMAQNVFPINFFSHAMVAYREKCIYLFAFFAVGCKGCGNVDERTI